MTPTSRSNRLLPAGLLGVVLLAVAATACGSATSGRTDAPASTSIAVFPAAAPIDPVVGVSIAPVEPLVAYERSTFEGLPVLSYVPEHPAGIVYFFHGTGGGADIVTKIEAVDVVNELVRAGYGFVATESGDRTAKQWDVDDPSMSTNADLARMARLRTQVIETTAVDDHTPMFGIGMSNGSAFTALWAAAFTGAGTPVEAVGLYMAGPTRAVDQLGGLRVPTFMVVGVNDTRTNPTKEKADLAEIAAAGVATELHEVEARAITPLRYLRVPGLSAADADAVVAAYRQAGVIDSAGALLIALPKISAGDDAADLLPVVKLPAGLTADQRQAVGNETLATLGEHQFNAEFKVQNVAFFDGHG